MTNSISDGDLLQISSGQYYSPAVLTLDSILKIEHDGHCSDASDSYKYEKCGPDETCSHMDGLRSRQEWYTEPASVYSTR